jgi:hypothetical protein
MFRLHGSGPVGIHQGMMIVEGFHLARTWVPHEGPKGIERRGLNV